MKTNLLQLVGNVAFGLLLTLPVIVLELWNQPASRQDFPFLLFGWLWFLSALFVRVVRSIVNTLRTGNIMERPIQLLAAMGFLILIVTMWSGLMVDQMPCFLGVPNCD